MSDDKYPRMYCPAFGTECKPYSCMAANKYGTYIGKGSAYKCREYDKDVIIT